MTNKHVEKDAPPVLIRESAHQNDARQHSTPSTLENMEKSGNANVVEAVEKLLVVAYMTQTFLTQFDMMNKLIMSIIQDSAIRLLGR